MSRFVIRSETTWAGVAPRADSSFILWANFAANKEVCPCELYSTPNGKTKEFCPPGSGEFVNSISAQPIHQLFSQVKKIHSQPSRSFVSCDEICEVMCIMSRFVILWVIVNPTLKSFNQPFSRVKCLALFVRCDDMRVMFTCQDL